MERWRGREKLWRNGMDVEEDGNDKEWRIVEEGRREGGRRWRKTD